MYQGVTRTPYTGVLLRILVVCHQLNECFREADATGIRTMGLLMSSRSVPEYLFGICSFPRRDMSCQCTHSLFLPWQILSKLGMLRMRAEEICPGLQLVIGQRCCRGSFDSVWCFRASCCLMEIIAFIGYLYLCTFWHSRVNRIYSIV